MRFDVSQSVSLILNANQHRQPIQKSMVITGTLSVSGHNKDFLTVS